MWAQPFLSTWNVRWHGKSKRPQHLYLRVPCHESRPRKVFVMYRWRSGYSKWCRVKIYEVGKAHLGIVHRIVFDPSRPLRKARNPTLITMSTSSGWVKRVGDRTCMWLWGGVKDLRWRIWGGQAVIFWFLGPRRSSSKFLITAVRRTSKFIAAGKISILTDNLLTR